MGGGPRQEKVPLELLRSAAEAMLIVDARGRILWNNIKAEKLFGYDEKELVGRPVEDLVPSYLQEEHARHREGYLRNPRNRPMGAGLDLRARRRDGSEFPVEISLSHSGTGEELRVMAMVTDVSQSRSEKERIRQREEECRELVQNVLEQQQGAVFLLDRDLEVVWCSRGVEDLFDLMPLEMAGAPFGPVLANFIVAKLEDGEAFRQNVMRSYGEGKYLSAVPLRLPAAGQVRHLEYGSRPVKKGRHAGGRVERFEVRTAPSKSEDDQGLSRQRLAELEEEFRTLKRLGGPLPTPVSSRMLDIPPLRESLPDVFSSLSRIYESLLEQAMEKRIYKVEHDLSGPLRTLADKLGSVKAGPRDVLDVHRDVLQRKEIEEASPKLRGYVEEGYLLLVELLGDLLSIYRNHAFTRMGRREGSETTGG